MNNDDKKPKKDTTDNYNKDVIKTFPVINSRWGRTGTEEGEINLEPSKTIQGETYTIRELLRKHQSGAMPDVARNPIWEDTDDFESLDLQKISRLDISEKTQLTQQQWEVVDASRRAVKEAQASAEGRDGQEQTNSTGSVEGTEKVTEL